MIKYYNLKNISLALILGLNESTIIEILQRTVHKVFPIRFSHQNQTKKEQTLICSLKRKSEELKKIYNNEESSIFREIGLEVNGKNITLKSIQALMVMHEEKKVALYNANCNIKWLKDKVI